MVTFPVRVNRAFFKVTKMISIVVNRSDLSLKVQITFPMSIYLSCVSSTSSCRCDMVTFRRA